jgi:hypothetical protein
MGAVAAAVIVIVIVIVIEITTTAYDQLYGGESSTSTIAHMCYG